MWLTLGRKTVFVNICSLLMVRSKIFVKTNPNFPQDLSHFKHLKKNKLTGFFSAPFCWWPLFGIKRDVLCEFPQKCFKTTEKHSLSVCCSLWGEKQVFFLIFPPFYRFDQKQLFKQILIFIRICPFQTCLGKNFLSVSVLFSEIVTFWTKKWKFSVNYPPKCFKTTQKHSSAVCGSLWGEKLVFVNISLLLLIWSKIFV